jgi:oxygen-dependent protoporphyrinogen oxidase
VIIVGGGITGLSAAWRLHRAGVPFLLLESSDRWGGKIRTEHVDGYTLEMGADAFLLRKPWARQLAAELGLDERVQPVNRPPVSTYVLHRGKPVPLPDGLALLVPSRWGPFARSPLFTPWGKARAALDLVLPRRRNEDDETLASFITRRLGREMLEKVAEPMLAGVFNGEADRQSMQATFPQFPALEREYGSLIRGIRAKRAASASTDAQPFFSFMAGAQEMVDAIVRQLPSSSLRLNAPVARVEVIEDGAQVILRTGETLEGAAALLATSASFAAAAIEGSLPDAARALREIRYTGIGTAYLAYRREHVPHPLDAYGVVIPSRERRSIDGMTWTTTKWSGRAPEGHMLIRVFFGGPHTRASIAMSDGDLQRMIQRELAEILGVHADPMLWRVHRWHDAYPQYDLGHIGRVSRIERALPPEVVVAGSAYRGVGVPDCVRQGNEAADRIIHLLRREPAA